MPNVARLLALSLLLAAGCGSGERSKPTWSGSFALGAATEKARISINAWRGKVRFRNNPGPRVEVTLRGDAPIPLEKALLAVEGKPTTPSRITLAIDPAAKDSALEIEVAAPAGISLSCSCADADVDLSGAWAHVEVRTGGAISARVARLDEGLLETKGGALSYVAESGPKKELTAKSMGGNVVLRLPEAWSGQVHCNTQTGKLDVPPRAGFRTKWDEDGKGVIGHYGAPREPGVPLPTIFGSSLTGSVSFQVGEG